MIVRSRSTSTAAECCGKGDIFFKIPARGQGIDASEPERKCDGQYINVPHVKTRSEITRSAFNLLDASVEPGIPDSSRAMFNRHV
jgi:hypothetical protein